MPPAPLVGQAAVGVEAAVDCFSALADKVVRACLDRVEGWLVVLAGWHSSGVAEEAHLAAWVAGGARPAVRLRSAVAGVSRPAVLPVWEAGAVQVKQAGARAA